MAAPGVLAAHLPVGGAEDRHVPGALVRRPRREDQSLFKHGKEDVGIFVKRFGQSAFQNERGFHRFLVLVLRWQAVQHGFVFIYEF